jgi:hypothetical protein
MCEHLQTETDALGIPVAEKERDWERLDRTALRQAALARVLPLALVLCASCAVRDADMARYEAQWAQSEQALASERSVAVFRSRLALIGSRCFAHVQTPTRHDRLLSTASLGEELQQDAEAHQLFVVSSQMEQAGFEDWDGRLETASRLHDHLDVMRSLTHIVRGWPRALSSYAIGFIVQAASRTSKSREEGAAAFELRLALYEASFRREYQVAPDSLWGLLARDLLERGRGSEALTVISAINSPRTILSLRVDRRFEGLVRLAPARFDVMAAADRRIHDYQQAVQREPRSLDALVQLTYAYLDAGRYAETLRTAGLVLARVQDPNVFHAAYDDDETALNWLLNNYGHALEATQPWEDAKGVLEIASEGLEHGTLNISNVINLAWFYGCLGRADEALRVLAEIPEDASTLSPYGRMQWHEVRLIAAVEKGDLPLVRLSLEYMRAHQDDATVAYLEALLWAGHEAEAARLLVARLADPARYVDALLAVQSYKDPHAPPVVMRYREKWRKVISRPEVRRAIAKVGHIESVPLPSAAE